MQEAPKVEVVPLEKIRHPTVLGVMKRQKKAELEEKKVKRKAANEMLQSSEKQTEDLNESGRSPKNVGKQSGNDTNRKDSLKLDYPRAPVATSSQVFRSEEVSNRLNCETFTSKASRITEDPENALSDVWMQEAPRVEAVPPKMIPHEKVLGVMIDNPEYVAYVKRQKKAEREEKKAQKKTAIEASQYLKKIVNSLNNEGKLLEGNVKHTDAEISQETGSNAHGTNPNTPGLFTDNPGYKNQMISKNRAVEFHQKHIMENAAIGKEDSLELDLTKQSFTDLHLSLPDCCKNVAIHFGDKAKPYFTFRN